MIVLHQSNRGSVGIGRADNAALLAVHIMATADSRLAAELVRYRSAMRDKVRAADQGIQPDSK